MKPVSFPTSVKSGRGSELVTDHALYGLLSGRGRVPNGAEYLLLNGVGSASLSTWSYIDSLSLM